MRKCIETIWRLEQKNTQQWKNYTNFSRLLFAVFRPGNYVKFSTANTATRIIPPQTSIETNFDWVWRWILWPMLQITLCTFWIDTPTLLHLICIGYRIYAICFDQTIYCWLKQIYKIPIYKAFKWTTQLNPHPPNIAMKRNEGMEKSERERMIEKEKKKEICLNNTVIIHHKNSRKLDPFSNPPV